MRAVIVLLALTSLAGFIQAKPSPEPQKIDIDIDDNLWDKLRDNFFDSELFDGEVGSTIKNVYKLVKDGDGGLGSIKNIYKLVRELVRRKKRSADPGIEFDGKTEWDIAGSKGTLEIDDGRLIEINNDFDSDDFWEEIKDGFNTVKSYFGINKRSAEAKDFSIDWSDIRDSYKLVKEQVFGLVEEGQVKQRMSKLRNFFKERRISIKIE